MELKVEIGFEQLVQAIKQLPANQFLKLKAEINKTVPTKTKKEQFRAFLLKAPVFTADQIALIEDAGKSINKMGKKIILLDTSILIEFFRKTPTLASI